MSNAFSVMEMQLISLFCVYSKAKREEETKLKTDRDQNTARLRQREHELSQKRVDLSNAQVRLNRRQESERKVKDLQVTSEQHSADIKVSSASDSRTID